MLCPELSQGLPELSQGLPELRQSLPELTQTSTASQGRRSYRFMLFFTFSYPSHLKHLVLRAFLEDGLAEMLSKLGVLAERGTKSKKTSRDSSGGQKHMVKCQVSKLLTLKTQ